MSFESLPDDTGRSDFGSVAGMVLTLGVGVSVYALLGLGVWEAWRFLH